MTPGHEPPVLRPTFRDHKTDDLSDDLIEEGKFFTPEEFRNADHQIKGHFDEYGQFRGTVSVYGEEFPDHIVSWQGGHGLTTRCGPFTIQVAVVQGESRATTLPLEDWNALTDKMDRFGGLYIYRDGVRVLPYGNNDYDWLDIERNRSKSARYYYFSYRRMEAFLQAGCRCQKHPCTKITVPYLGRTMSGVPGRSLRCSRKRKPKRCSMERTRSSGRVFFPRTFDIRALRWEGVSLSMNTSGPGRPRASRAGEP